MGIGPKHLERAEGSPVYTKAFALELQLASWAATADRAPPVPSEDSDSHSPIEVNPFLPLRLALSDNLLGLQPSILRPYSNPCIFADTAQ